VGAGEDTLITRDIWGPEALRDVGDYIKISVWGGCANTAATKRVRVKYGTLVLLDFNHTTNAQGWWNGEATVVKTSASNVDFGSFASATFSGGGAAVLSNNNGSANITDTGAITVSTTGEATNNDDITQEGMTIQAFKKAIT